MKKVITCIAMVSCVWGAELDMPPSIPVLNTQPQKTDANATKQNSCDLIPPMLHMLPPPLQGELDKCVNEKNKPSVKAIKAYLEKNKIKYKDIKIQEVKDFVRLYEVDLGNKKTMYCNEKVTKCFEVK